MKIMNRMHWIRRKILVKTKLKGSTSFPRQMSIYIPQVHDDGKVEIFQSNEVILIKKLLYLGKL